MGIIEAVADGAASLIGSDAAAAWVQAAGAIIALALAIWLPRRDNERRRRVFRDTVWVYATMVRDAVSARALEDGTFQQVLPSVNIQEAQVEIDLRSVLNALEQLPMAQLESARATNAVIRLVGAARSFDASRADTPLTIDEAVKILDEGMPPRRYAAGQVMQRWAELHGCLTSSSDGGGPGLKLRRK